MNAGLLLFILLVILSFIGLPLFLAIAVATMVALASAGFPLETIAQKTFLGLNSASLLSIPFFILAGNVMAQGITQKLLDVANALLGRVRGSLAAVTVVASGLFGAISGSGVATVSAIGGMTIPAMEKEGYDKNFATAVAASSSLLGPLVPPSITLIVYASLTEVSVQKLFMATAIPAATLALLYLLYVLWYGKKKNLPKQEKMGIATSRDCSGHYFRGHLYSHRSGGNLRDLCDGGQYVHLPDHDFEETRPSTV